MMNNRKKQNQNKKNYKNKLENYKKIKDKNYFNNNKIF